MLPHFPATPVSTLGIEHSRFFEPHVGAFTALREVAEYLAGQTLAVDVETVNFAMHFPRFLGLCSRFRFR